VLFAYDTGKEFATKGKVPVMATFDGVPYTSSLFKYGNASFAGMPKAIRSKATCPSANENKGSVSIWKCDAAQQF
jgi:hypothetical protein